MRKSQLTFEDATHHVRNQCVKLQRDAKKSLNDSFPVRLVKSMIWKYNSNEIVQGVYEIIFFWIWLGVICVCAALASYYELNKPWL